MTTTTPRVSPEQAARVLDLVRRQCLPYWNACPAEQRPTVDFTGRYPVIRWESGSPADWALRFPHGGTDEEMGNLVQDVAGYDAACKAAAVAPVTLPAGVSVDAIDSFTIGLHIAD